MNSEHALPAGHHAPLSGEKRHYVVIIPVYNDWESASILLGRLDSTLAAENISAEVLVVDDGSSQPGDSFMAAAPPLQAIRKVEVLRLNRNLGHQRAIAIALSYVSERQDYTAAVIMDGDGEDDPADVPRLISEGEVAGEGRIIFAARGKRSEGLIFRSFYYIYKKMYSLMTGVAISFGNFSMVPRQLLERLVVVAELWNNYPASVMKARLPYGTITTRRGCRYTGSSRMNLVSLIIHGLSAISVFGEIIGVRALIAMILLSILSFLSIVIVVAIRLILPEIAVPGWASYLVASFLVILLQSFTMTLFFIFMILHSRNYTSFLPRRDFRFYILDSRTVYRR